MRHVKQIVIGLENCEEVILPVEACGRFELDDIRRRVMRIGANEVFCADIANEVSIEILPVANSLGIITLSDNVYHDVINRLTAYNDIVSVKLCYDNGESYEVCVDYDYDYSESIAADNINQKSYVSSNGILYIVISKAGKGIADYFDLDIINAPNYQSWY